VAELDKHVVGQRAAKRPWRSRCETGCAGKKLPPDIAEEIMPKNIIMIGLQAWQNRDCAAAGQAHQLTLHEGGSLQVHRGWYVGRMWNR